MKKLLVCCPHCGAAQVKRTRKIYTCSPNQGGCGTVFKVQLKGFFNSTIQKMRSK